MPPETAARYSAMIHAPYGMVICAGPTGGGKTTTLYASLGELNTPDRNIMTIEDPVEYTFDSINQIQINEQAGVTFAGGLKSILRQDPDVILVGEIRDVDTARIAVQSALTGHLVLSSLHATESVAALYRLLDMGIEAFLIASSVTAVVAQRLVRRNCPHCAEPYSPSAEELAFLRAVGGGGVDPVEELPARCGLPPLRPHRLPGAHRGLRGPRGHRRGAGAARAAGPARRDAQARAEPGDAHAAGAGGAPGPRGFDDGGRGHAVDLRGRSLSMPKFAYVGVTLDGNEVKGTQRAASRSDAEVSLYERQMRHLRVTEKKSILKYELSGPRIKREAVMHLSRQIAAFLRAGLPILEAVHTIGAENENSSVRRMMNEIEDGLRSGERFSECLDKFPKVFPPFYRGIVRSAELTGELDTVLARLSGYIERDLEARRKLKSAMMYPLIVSAMSMVTVLILAIYVLPKFEDFFADLDAELPLPTRMLMGITGFLGHWWWAIAGGIAALVGAVHRDHPDQPGEVRPGRVPAQGPGARGDHPVRPGRALLPRPRRRWWAPA